MTNLVSIINNQPKTTSLLIAETFGKMHKNVVRAIEQLDIPEKFTRLNFEPSEYTDATGRKLKQYEITRDGFTLLAMGFTGKKAIQFKLAYIEAFNKMEQALATQPTLPNTQTRIQGILESQPAQPQVMELSENARNQIEAIVKQTIKSNPPIDVKTNIQYHSDKLWKNEVSELEIHREMNYFYENLKYMLDSNPHLQYSQSLRNLLRLMKCIKRLYDRYYTCRQESCFVAEHMYGGIGMTKERIQKYLLELNTIQHSIPVDF